MRLEQERVAAEELESHKAPTSQTQHTPVLGGHTPCFDEHGQELDYLDDVPAAPNSQEPRNWEEYFHDTNLQDAPGEAASLEAASLEGARILQGPTIQSTASEEAVLLKDEETPTVGMGQFLAGLETFTPAMLNELSAHIEHMRRLATPLASTESVQKETPSAPPPGLPAIPTVTNPMQQAILKAAGDLGTSPTCQRTLTRPPGEDETARAATIIVEQMPVKMPGAPLQKDDWP